MVDDGCRSDAFVFDFVFDAGLIASTGTCVVARPAGWQSWLTPEDATARGALVPRTRGRTQEVP